MAFVQEVLDRYTAALGAKCKAVALGAWNTAHSVMGIPYHTQLRILGVFMSTVNHKSAAVSWAKVTANIRAQARDAYGGDVTLHHRLQYVQMYTLSKAWYTVQVLPPKDSIKRINMAVSW